jgi:hypothetical protein
MFHIETPGHPVFRRVYRKFYHPHPAACGYELFPALKFLLTFWTQMRQIPGVTTETAVLNNSLGGQQFREGTDSGGFGRPLLSADQDAAEFRVYGVKDKGGFHVFLSDNRGKTVRSGSSLKIIHQALPIKISHTADLKAYDNEENAWGAGTFRVLDKPHHHILRCAQRNMTVPARLQARPAWYPGCNGNALARESHPASPDNWILIRKNNLINRWSLLQNFNLKEPRCIKRFPLLT